MTKRPRKLLCWAAGTLVIALASLYLWSSLSAREKSLEQEQTAFLAARDAEEKTAAEITSRLPALSGDEEWDALFADIEKLSPPRKDELALLAKVKRFEARSTKRDNLLYSAGQLLKVNKNDPVATGYIEEARALHEKNIKSLSDLQELPGNCPWNKVIWYRLGMEYYRSLIFLPPDKKADAQDIVDHAVSNFEKVFTCYPKDHDAEVALELLYKKADASSDPSSGGAKIRVELLPSEAVEGQGGDDPRSIDRSQGRH